MTSRSHMRLKITLLAFAAFVCLIVAGAVGVASPKTPAPDQSQGIVKPDGLKWTPFIGPMQMALVSGDPSQPGAFVVRVKIPSGTVVAPHWHSTDEYLTVLDGQFSVAMGDVFDAGKLSVMERGDFIQMPAKMNHYAKAVTDTVVQLHGMGPFTLNFVNPADDPRLKR